MPSKRLNIMLYSSETGEQIIFPINPENIEIKYEKSIEKFDILGYGEINIMGNPKPIEIKLSHFLPEDDSIFGTTNSGIIYNTESSSAIECGYSSVRAVEILKSWAVEKSVIRLVIDNELNMDSIITSFSETIRENTTSKPYTIIIAQYKNPSIKTTGTLGLINRTSGLQVPKTILMKANDTVYSIASKYDLDFKILAQNNGIKDVNSQLEGTRLSTWGA